MLPKLPALDAKSIADRLRAAIRKPNGEAYAVWDQIQPYFVGLRAREEATGMQLAALEKRVTALEQGAPPPPPPPSNTYAPRAYNSVSGGSDARFCMDSKWGVRRTVAGEPGHWADSQNIFYDEGGRDLGGRSMLQVPELKPANQMDDRLPCDSYVGPTGVHIGGSSGYPLASFER